ncbi:hypothetical protein NMY22_g18264 [Coprinellus aureogranulatus]|nr:hypothetical protein NMY22_g18264 [Coprinellus aureogranulatus]
MARGRDNPNPSNIIPGRRATRESARAQGQDYPTTLQEKEAQNNKKRKALSDPTKPAGEASNADGTLKDAEELDFNFSPSDRARREALALLSGDDAGGRKRPRLGSIHSGAETTEAEVSEEEEPRPGHLKKRQSIVTEEVSDDDEAEEDEDEVTQREELKDTVAKRIENKGPREAEDKDMTKDLRLCFSKSERTVKVKTVDGNVTKKVENIYYCRWCVDAKEVGKKTSMPENKTYLRGNSVSVRRRHVTRNHWYGYHEICEENDIEPKIPSNVKPPKGWKEPSERTEGKDKKVQGTLKGYAVAVKKKVEVTKAGILEHIIALIVTCHLAFRFCEAPAFRRLIFYLNPSIKDSDIPKKTCVSEAVAKKVARLNGLTKDLIETIPGKASIVWDGWLTAKHTPYTSVIVTYITSDPDNSSLWSLKKNLIEFNPTPGRHTGEMIGEDLVKTMQHYGVDKKVGWMVGDGVSSNDVAVRYVCKTLDPAKTCLDPKQVRMRCIDHSMHRGAHHFIKALGVSSITASRANVHGRANAVDDEDDVDVSLEIEADADDTEAILASTNVDFDIGDIIGKLLAFVNQLQMSSEPVREFLVHLCRTNGLLVFVLKLWVRTRWASLSDCLESCLRIRIAVDDFCLTADYKSSLPKLTNGKKWSDFLLSDDERKLVKCAYHCLRLVAEQHNKLSIEDAPTCTWVYPLLEMLLSDWEALLKDDEFEPVHDALRAGIKNLEKYYRLADETDAYFISHVLDPTFKLEYLTHAWDSSYSEGAKTKMEKQFLEYKAIYDVSSASAPAAPVKVLAKTDAWMAHLVKNGKVKAGSVAAAADESPLAELHRWFDSRPLSRDNYPNPIPWWVHQSSEWPVLRMMARDYLAIPGTTCIAERSFSFSKRTDSHQCRQMKGNKFGGLQKLLAGYTDGRLDADLEIIRKFVGDFDYDGYDGDDESENDKGRLSGDDLDA